MNSSKRTTESLRIQWLESTLEFTREKINLEDVLASLMKYLAETTVSSRAVEQKMACLIAKGPFIYYVSTFLGFFDPPLLLKHVFRTENKPKLQFSDPPPLPSTSAYVIYEWSSSPTHYCKPWGWSCCSAKKSKKSWWPSIPCWRHQRRWKVQKSVGSNRNRLHFYLSFCVSFLFRLNLDLGGYGGLWFPCPPSPSSGAPGRPQRRPRKQQRGRTRRRIRSWRVNLLFYPMINEARPSYLAATYSTQWCILYFFCPIWCHVLWFVASNQWIIAPNKKNIW